MTIQKSTTTNKINNLLIHNNFYEAILNLSNENSGLLFKKIFTYHLKNEILEANDFVDFMFLSFKDLIDENKISYIEKCNKNKENVKKRWNTTVYDRIPNDTKHTNIKEENIKEENIKEENIKEENINNLAEEVYNLYYLKKGKKDGITKLIKILEKSKDIETLINKIKKHIELYNNNCSKDNYKFMKHFNTYVNQECWNDLEETKQIKKQIINHLDCADELKRGVARIEDGNKFRGVFNYFILTQNDLEKIKGILNEK